MPTPPLRLARRQIREVQELPNVLVPNLLRPRVRQVESQLIDHLRPLTDPFAPALRARILVTQLPELALERLRRQPRLDLPAPPAKHLALADLQLRLRRLELRHRGAQA